MKLLITGAGGMLGTDLCEELAGKHDVVGVDFREVKLPVRCEKLDLMDAGAVQKLFSGFKPDVVIHAAAYTHVDGCESDRKGAFDGNVRITEIAAGAAKNAGALFVFFSTDYIFDGKKQGAYTEEDLPAPLNYYGETKVLAEKNIRQNLAHYAIIRISWLYGIHGKSFPRTILERARTQQHFDVVSDQTGRPTYTRDLANAIGDLLSGDIDTLKAKCRGIFHLTNSGETSWAGLAKFVLETAGFKKHTVKEISTEQLQRPAARPKNSVLSLDKSERELGVKLRSWQEAVKDFVKEYQSQT